MDYNFTGQFPFPWPSSGPFLANGFPAFSNTSTTQPSSVFGNQQVSLNQNGVVPGFSSDVLFNGQRFTGASAYPFGINPRFNTYQSRGSSNFATDWNYGFVNRFPRFSNGVSGQPQIPALPMSNAVNAICNSNVPPVNNTTAVSDGNLNGIPSVNSVQNVETKSDNSCEQSTAKVGEKSEASIIQKSNDDITNEIALKVSSLLSNPLMLQSAISHIQAANEKSNGDDVSERKKQSCDNMSKLEGATVAQSTASRNETDNLPPSVRETKNESVRSVNFFVYIFRNFSFKLIM